MPRYNIKHGSKYYVYSTIVDAMIAEFDSFEELQSWRLQEYGVLNFDEVKTFEEMKSNKMELKDTIISMILGGNETEENITKYFMQLDDKDKNEVFKNMVEAYQQRINENE